MADGLVVQTRIPQDFNRGRNIAVTDEPRPDYTALGLRYGSLLFYPRIEAGGGATSNAYLDDHGAKATPILYVRPSARLVSDWSRHYLQLSGSATFRDYLGESRRDERLWDINAISRLDIRRTLTVQATASAAQAFENLFSGEVASSVAALSRYRRDFASLQATYTLGRGRAFIVTDYTGLRFRPVPLLGGGERDQSDRNRRIYRVAGQVEYARSPSISLFAQLSGTKTVYNRDLLSGSPNLDSRSARLLAGANVDIAGRIRGTIGVGYSIRDYDAVRYKTVRGVSVESTIQFFPTQRVTLTLSGDRTIEDASLNRSSYWNTQISAGADYELLHNLIVSASVQYWHQNYLGSTLAADIYRGQLSGRYLVSRRVNLTSTLSYGTRNFDSTTTLRNAAEARIEAGIAYQL